MFQEVISFEKALLLEQEGKIVIYNPNQVESVFSSILEWKNNWEQLRKKFRKISSNKLASFASFEYIIEHKFMEGEDPITTNWVYMYGQDTGTREKLDQFHTKGQYVYILTNVAYPGVCKIGKAINPQKRVRQINNAGVISEWDLRYALPVSDDYKVEKLIHDELGFIRMNSFQNSSREFFEIEFMNAVSVIENLASEFKTGNPTFY